jgi:hypothetical protein
MNYAQMHENFQRTSDTKYFEFAPQLARDLARNWAVPKPSREQTEAQRWATALTLPGNAKMAGLGFVCRYALTANRKVRND